MFKDSIGKYDFNHSSPWLETNHIGTILNKTEKQRKVIKNYDYNEMFKELTCFIAKMHFGTLKHKEIYMVYIRIN